MDILFESTKNIFKKYNFDIKKKKEFKSRLSNLIKTLSQPMKITSLKYVKFAKIDNTNSNGKAEIIFEGDRFYTYIILSLSTLEYLLKGGRYGAASVRVIKHELYHIKDFENIIAKCGTNFLYQYNFFPKQKNIEDIYFYFGINTWFEYYAYRNTGTISFAHDIFTNMLDGLSTMINFINGKFLKNKIHNIYPTALDGSWINFAEFFYHIAKFYGVLHFNNISDFYYKIPEIKADDILSIYMKDVHDEFVNIWDKYPQNISEEQFLLMGKTLFSIFELFKIRIY